MSKKTKEIAQSLTEQAFKAVKKQLNKGNVSIPQQNQNNQFPIINKSRISKQQQKQSENLHSILKKRKLLEQELNRVRYDQQIAKQKRPHPMIESDQGKTKYFRSTITPQEKDKINHILRQTTKFQALASKKTEQLIQRIKKIQLQEKKAKQIQQKLKLEQKKNSAEKHLKQIEQRKKQRAKQINKANKQFQRVSKSKFLHQSIQQKWLQSKRMQNEQNSILLQKNKQEKKFKIEEIKQHSRRYSQLANSFKEKRQHNIEKLKDDLLQYSRMAKHSHSTFFKTLTVQQQQKRQSLQQKMRQSQQLNEKKAIYAQTVRQKHMSNFKPQNSSKIQSASNIDIRSSKSLDNLGLNKLGNVYMKQIHSCIGEVTQTRVSHKNQLATKKPQQSQVFKYPDYLTKARTQRKQKNPQQQPYELKELKTIISRKNEDKQMRLYKAKALVNKLDQNNKGKPKNMINTIMAKLSLIEEFSQPQ